MQVHLVYVTGSDFVGLLPVAAFRTREAADAFMAQPERQEAIRLLDVRMGIKVMLLQDVCTCDRTKDTKGFCPSCDELKF